jgi:hypothetical protein
MYKLVKTNRGNGLNRVNEDGSVTSIPFVTDNTDYQEYLKWVAEGNTPEPAENT